MLEKLLKMAEEVSETTEENNPETAGATLDTKEGDPGASRGIKETVEVIKALALIWILNRASRWAYSV